MRNPKVLTRPADGRPRRTRKILIQDGEFVLTVNLFGSHLVFHCHCDDCGGSRNGPEYWASCFRNECRDCEAKVPDAMLGMIKLAEWNPGKTTHGLR
jgi:hypothetical protein